MTEAEAKEKICPVRRTDTTEKKCLASECMMWRNATVGEDGGYCALAFSLNGRVE